MSEKNENQRLEMFCDGVFAIALTILILEIKVPVTESVHSIHEFWQRIAEGWPSWFGFILSFCIILITWVNHHGAFKLIDKSSIQFIYANGFLLFTIVIIPFSTALAAQYFKTPYVQPAISLYCFTVLLHNIGWNILGWAIMRPVQLIKNESNLKRARKGIRDSHRGFFFYLFIFILSFWLPVTAMILNTLTWLLWIVLGFVLAKNKTESPSV